MHLASGRAQGKSLRRLHYLSICLKPSMGIYCQLSERRCTYASEPAKPNCFVTLDKMLTFLSFGCLTLKDIIGILRRSNEKMHKDVLVHIKSNTNVNNEGHPNDCSSHFLKLVLSSKNLESLIKFFFFFLNLEAGKVKEL